MSQYDGLNLPELMELMHELVMPAEISRLPQTPGWWILLVWLFATMLLLVRYWLQKRRRNRYRREALASLNVIERQEDLSATESAQCIATLLKQTALAAYPRQQVASLTGDAWASFLIASSENDALIVQTADTLAAAAYRPDADGREISAAARRWIRVHRA